MERKASTATLLLAVGVLALTVVHHVYGAAVYDTPWRNHAAILALPVILLLIAAHTVHQRRPGTFPGRGSRKLFIWITLLVPVLAVGTFEGGYNHVAKNVLYFSGAADTMLNRLYPPPVYEMPGDVLFELTGILQFVAAAGLTYYLVRLWNE